jgi:hypothetical protein
MFMHANRAFDLSGYDHWWNLGRQSAENGEPRHCPNCFWFVFDYLPSCWFDGYDNYREGISIEV